MPNEAKREATIKLVITTLVLYSMTVLIYMIKFYKPFKPVYNYEDLNKTLKSIHIESNIFFFIISFMACIIISIIFLLILQEIQFLTQPIIPVYARLKSKGSTMEARGSHTGSFSVGFSYKLTFELEDGRDISFRVIPKHYAINMEGNKGILKYKQRGAFVRFVDFDIKEIE